MTDEHQSSVADEPRSVAQTARLVAIGVLALVAVALALDNRDSVEIGWVVGDASTPLTVALVVAFVLGLAIGFLGGRRRR